MALIMMASAWEEEGDVHLAEPIPALKSRSSLINTCLSSGLVNLLDLEHGKKGRDSVYERVYLEIAHWPLGC